MRDVLLYVYDSLENYDGTVTVHGTWWNKGQMGKPWSMNVEANLTLTQEQLRDWVKYD
jgi:hypothetical protein